MPTKNREKMLLIGTAAVVILFMADRFVLSPLTDSWKDRKGRIADLTKQIEQGKMIESQERKIEEHWTDMKTNMLSENISLAEADLFKAFDRWAKDSGISVSSLRPQPKQGDDFTTIECRVDAAGNINAISKFLYNIEKDPLGVRVQNVEITARDDNGQQLALGLMVSGVINTPPTTQP